MTTFELVAPLVAVAVAIVGILFIRHSAHQLETRGVEVRTDRDRD